jgi:hypothetical protein
MRKSLTHIYSKYYVVNFAGGTSGDINTEADIAVRRFDKMDIVTEVREQKLNFRFHLQNVFYDHKRNKGISITEKLNI